MIIKPPRLPDSPKEWSPKFQDTYSRILILFFKKLTNISTGFFTSLIVTDMQKSSPLTSSLSAVDTTITVDDITIFEESGFGTIETEKFSWTGISGNDLTGVTRGVLGTTAATHSSSILVVPTARKGVLYTDPTTNAVYRIF